MLTCWGLTSGNAGMEAQVAALASALQISPIIKKVSLRKPLVYLPNQIFDSRLRSFIFPYGMGEGKALLEPPWPDMVISCGRRAALVAMGMRAKSHDGRTSFIHVQDPQVSAENFDIVVAMAHDKITGPNVIKTRFALHKITSVALENSHQAFASRFSGYPKPHVAVLLGGSTNKYTLAPAAMQQVISTLQRLLTSMQGSLLITPSHRTGENNIALLRQAFANNPRVYIYDFISENPYIGLLALADAIIVSNDSVNMMSEAYATGKPIYILPLPGHANTKPTRFAQGLINDGIARTLGKKLEFWSYPVVDEMTMVMKEIKMRLPCTIE